MLKLRYATLLLLILFQGFVYSQSTIKIMTYNTKDASSWSDRLTYLHDVISSTDPDIIVAIEIKNTKTDDFLINVLNSTSTIYSKGTFIPNNSSISTNSNCLYYKTSRFMDGTFDNTIIPSYIDLTQTTQDRDINRFTITQNGGETIVIYAVHLIANGSGGDATKRAVQISYLQSYISDNAPSTTSENFIVLGDFNIKDPTEGAYINLFVSQGGYFYDPSNPAELFTGTWHQSEFIPYLSFRTAGITDKFDNILISGNVKDNLNGIKYNTGSFTVYGNPGSYNAATLDTNVRQASDHLPVYATFEFADSPAPVELVSFSGFLNQNHVDLNWKTETEVNNFGFEIERIINKSDWETIGFVEGHGNSNSPKQYIFIDTDVEQSGYYHYRLKQLDNDGTYEYSDIVTIEAGIPNNYYLSQNYPNPFNPETRIYYTLPEKQLVSLRIYNTLGELVRELVNEVKEAGSYSVMFNASNLSSGIYIYMLRTSEFTENKKMILLK